MPWRVSQLLTKGKEAGPTTVVTPAWGVGNLREQLPGDPGGLHE